MNFNRTITAAKQPHFFTLDALWFFFNPIQEDSNGFIGLVDGILEDVFNFATLIPRVAHLDMPDYLEDVEEMEELSDMREEILRRVNLAITKVKGVVNGIC